MFVENETYCIHYAEKPMDKGIFGHNSTNVPIESSFVLAVSCLLALPLQPKS